MKALKMILILFFIGISAVMQAQSSSDQTVEQTLSKLSKIAAQKYLEPGMTAFGSNLNSGWVNMIPSPKKLGFDLTIKFVGMGTFLTDKPTTFSTAGSFKFTSSQADNILANSGISMSDPSYEYVKQQLLSKEWNVNFNGPTIIGKDNEYLRISFPGGTVAGRQLNAYTETVTGVKGLLNGMSMLPTGAPQITVGTLMGTAVSFRYLPSISFDNLGSLDFWGVGIIHNPEVWLQNPLPVNIAIGIFTQKLKLGTIVETNATQYGIYVSKTFGDALSITPYVGFTIESSKTKVNYDYEYSTIINGASVQAKDKINFEIEGENSGSLLLGMTFKLIVVNINVDYKLAKYNTLSGGISFAF